MNLINSSSINNHSEVNALSNINQTTIHIHDYQFKLHNKLKQFKYRSRNQSTINLAGIEIDKSNLNKKLSIEPDDELFIVNVIGTRIYSNNSNSKYNYLLNELCVDQIIPTLHPQAQKLVNEFKCVFPEVLPKVLPPKLHIEHRIDLVTGAQPVNQPIYRMKTTLN